MNDPLLVLVGVVLMIAVPFDVYVAWRFTTYALQRPRYRILTLAALRSIAIAIAAVIAGILGAQSIYFSATGERFLPTPVPTVLIAIALVVISLPNVYALRWLSTNDEQDVP